MMASCTSEQSDNSPDHLADRVRELEGELASLREEHAELAERESRLNRAVSGSTVCLWDWEVGTNNTHYDHRLAELLGYDPGDEEFALTFENFTERLHPDDRASTLQAINEHLDEDLRYDIEYRLRCKNGEYRWFRARGEATRDENGRASSMAGGITDVTDRALIRERLIEARRAAEAANEQLNAFFDLSLDLLCIAGTDGYFKRINPAFMGTLGYTGEELLARPFLDFVHPDDQERTTEAVARLAGGAEVVRVENRYRHCEGHYLWLEWSAAEASGGSIYALARDVTQRREKEEEIREARSVAEAASTAKSEFLANMSHEIRTPMNAIIGMSELLLNTSLSSRQEEYQKLVLESAESLLETMNDVLDFSKIEAGRIVLAPQEFELRTTMIDTLRSLEVRARQEGLTLAQYIAPEVPAVVNADQGRLRQVLVNLVGNAIKFTKEGKIDVTVDVTSREGSTAVLRVQVSDTGIGVPAEKLSAIFEPFSQAEGSTSRRFEGAGLGLSISKQIVSLMRGELWMESEVGEGSKFGFSVPVEVEESKRETVLSASKAVLEPKPDDVPVIKVLLVEDSRANQLVATRFLERRGHSVTVAENGREAIAAFSEGEFDVILMDIHMPEMNGFEATGLIRELEIAGSSRIPIIAMTANALRGDRDACLAAGMDDYLAKPVHALDLYETLERHAVPS